MAKYVVAPKERKPRGIKLNGQKSLDMCTCYSFHCDPMTVSPAFSAKIERRRAAGLCPSCGVLPKRNRDGQIMCKCKSKLKNR